MPSKRTAETLNRQMFLSKELYNLLLEKSKVYYKETGKTLTEYRMNIWITQVKRDKGEIRSLISGCYMQVVRKQGLALIAALPQHEVHRLRSMVYPYIPVLECGFNITPAVHPEGCEIDAVLF